MNENHVKTEVMRINGCTVRITYASESDQMEGLRALIRETLRQEAKRQRWGRISHPCPCDA